MDAFGLPKSELTPAVAALAYGSWQIDGLLQDWRQSVHHEQRFVANYYAGIRPVACDLTGFFRPQLQGCTSKHYGAQAGKALAATRAGLVGTVGHVGAG